MGLCAVAILTALSLAISALRSHQKGSDLEVGNAWAGQLLEQFVYGLPGTTASFWSSGAFASPYQTDSIRLGSTTFEGSVFLTDLSSAGSSGIRMVTVNVTWGSGAAGRMGSGQQTTALARLVYAH